MSVLVVDDSLLIQEQIIDDLAEAGIVVRAVGSGSDALERLRADRGIRLVISDVNMPDMDGIELAEAIRTELGVDGPSIFIVSAERSADAKARARALDVKAWIVKPYSKEQLQAAVGKVVGAPA